MFIHPNPLFRFSDVLPRTEVADFCGTPWISKANDRFFIYSRGQWALKRIGSSIVRSRNKTKGTILIPEYFCEISLTPLRTAEFDIRFYRITSGLEPDIADLDRITRTQGTPDIMLFVHYFGMPLNIGPTEVWCRENGVVLIEDAAHSLLPVPGIGDHAYPTIYTPWKFLNLPDGALLVLPAQTALCPTPRNEACGSSPYPLGWVARQLASRVVQGMGVPLHKIKEPRVKAWDESEPPIDPGKPVCTSLSTALLSRKNKKMTKIGRIREMNYRRLDRAIAESDARRYRLYDRVPDQFTPYVYPLQIIDGDTVEVITALNRMGIPGQPWSDLSPEVKGSSEYPLANALRKEVMVLPVHQDLTQEQIDWMARALVQLLSRRRHA